MNAAPRTPDISRPPTTKKPPAPITIFDVIARLSSAVVPARLRSIESDSRMSIDRTIDANSAYGDVDDPSAHETPDIGPLDERGRSLGLTGG